MRMSIAFGAAIALLTSCSAPRYYYYFDHQNHNPVKEVKAPDEKSVLVLEGQSSHLVASSDRGVVVSPPMLDKRVAKQRIVERKPGGQQTVIKHAQWKKVIRASMKATSRVNPKAQASGSLDYDLKMAAIFVVVGIVGLAISGNAFQIIGGLSLLIGVVFLIKWLIRQ